MNRRQEIINFLKTDTLKIKTTNGYNNDLNEMFINFLFLNQAEGMPYWCFRLGADERTEQESGLPIIKANCLFLGHMEIDNDVKREGLLTTLAEKWIEDWENYIYRKNIIPNRDNTCAIRSIPGIRRIKIKNTVPYFDGIGTTKFTVAINTEISFQL